MLLRPRLGASLGVSYQRRNLFKYFRSKKEPATRSNAIIEQDDLFHPLSKSPIPAMRSKGELIKRIGQCPITGRNITFECPISGYPTHHSEKEWQHDQEHQREYAWRLRQANEDEHDLRSGRPITEMSDLPMVQDMDFAVNFASWDTFFYTRGFQSVDSPRSVRHLSKLLTYPITIASVTHPFSPYQYKTRLTREGLRSMIDNKFAKKAVEGSELESKPIRIFVLGARGESMIPRPIWAQGGPLIFPNTRFEIHFIGPEAVRPPNSGPLDKPYRETADPTISFVTHNDFYHTIHDRGDVAPFDPYQDIFFVPCPGFGHPLSRKEWEPTISRLLETKCAIISTGFSQEDLETDMNAVADMCKDEFDMLIEPGINPFSSRKWDLSEYCPSRTTLQANWGLFAFRGKRYEVKLH